MSAVSFLIAFFYAAYFAVVGVAAPYWPVWLEAQGMGPGEIGVLLSAALWLKVFANPLIAQAADKRRSRRGFMVALSVLALLGYIGFALFSGFWWYLLLAIFVGVAFSATLPLGESLGLAQVYVRRLDYGRLRLWGSITFIAASVGIGHLLADGSENLILWAILALLASVVVAAAFMPPAAAQAERPAAGTIRILLAKPVFLLFIATTSLIQASHAMLYGFATLHWRAIGIADDLIGWLWAEGVVAEILLFSISNRIIARLGVSNLLLLAAAGALIRWLLMGVSVDFSLLVVAQVLHGLTFGAAHLAAMHFIARAIEPEMTATAQSLNAALAGGVGSGLALMLAGWLYGHHGGQAFFAMALIAFAACVAALLLRRRWTGGRL